jgi:hypothetical protein
MCQSLLPLKGRSCDITAGMRFMQNFYRATAICSVISAVTTLLLIFPPKFYGPLTSLELRIEVVEHPLYQLRAWAYLLHPFMVMAAALGVAAALHRTAAGTVLPGLLCFLLWGFTEAAQQALTLTAFHRWAAAYRTADIAAREILRAQIAVYDALWDSMFLLLLIGFLVGNVLYGMATLHGRGLTRIISGFYFAAAFLTLTIVSGELRGPTLPDIISAWLYPLLQPAARFLIGVWLWRISEADRETSTSLQVS